MDVDRTLVRVVRTRHGFPSQWNAWTASGGYSYLRYRHGRGSVEWHRAPDDADDTPETWDEGLSGLLVEWDDATGGGEIDLEDFLVVAAGLVRAPDAAVD